MFRTQFRQCLKSSLLACAAGASLLASPAFAQQVDANKLLEIMVKKGLVTREEADAMIAEATTSAAAQPAPIPVPAGGVAADGTQTIPYVPQVVRDQIVEQVRTEMIAKAQSEGWAKSGEVAEWTKRITFFGDIRARADGMLFGEGNSQDLVNWRAINAGGGLQINQGAPGYVRPPYLNTVENRWAMRLRARLGLKARIDDWVSAEVRLATGNDTGPVSTNQTLGQHGEFGKYALWLDRANLTLTPVKDVKVSIGRFGNPFWSSAMQFDEDLNFDGVAISGEADFSDSVSVFGTAGFFPLFNTALNFGSSGVGTIFGGAYSSQDRYLAAGQIGLDFRSGDRFRARIAGGYYRFENAQGQLSAPCNFDQDACDTDAMRPAFQQFGNTNMPLRDVIPNPAVAPGASPEVQYFGLASKFQVISARGEIEYALGERVSARFTGDYIQNLGFDRARIAPLALNNFAPVIGTSGGQYDGGDKGWQAQLAVGRLGENDDIRAGDWSLIAGYRHVESDATLDAIADSDFGLGGTNMKGWFAGATYGFAKNTAFNLRWLSADEIAGPPLSVDHLMIDLTTRF
ncbi:putative porin [Sphingomonas koreensis]